MKTTHAASLTACASLLLWVSAAPALPPSLACPEQPDTQPAAILPELIGEPEPIVPLPIEPAATVAEALKLTPAEQTVLADIIDGNAAIRGEAMDVVLRHAAMLPVGRQTLDRADSTAVMNLIDSPQDYRMRLLKFPVRVWRVQKYRGLAMTRWWGRRDVWRFDCTYDAPVGRQPWPLIVLMTSLPPGFEAEGEYPRGPRATVAGLFYKKVVRERERVGADEVPFQAYPVLAANTLYEPPPTPLAESPVFTPGATGVVIVVAVVLLLAGFYLAKRYAKAKPMRVFELRRQRARQRGTEIEEEEQVEPVDPELARQVEQWQAEHAEDSDQDKDKS